jgi:tetratricopeptide (TPR) repeat protein
MRQITSIVLTAVCLWPAVGCRWAGLRDPVPAALAASRKLSSEGNELLERKQPDKAEAKLVQAVNTCPTDCDARRYYAETLWLRNARPEAIAQLEEACRLSPDSDLRVRLAEMYLEMGRLDEAGHHIDQVIDRNLKLSAAWRVRGRVLRCRGDRLLAAGNRDQAQANYLQALADLHRAAGFDPNDRQVIGETAAVYRSLGQPQRALESMQSLVETYSPGEEPQQVLYWTGLDCMALHRYDDAVANLSTAISRDRPTPELYYSLGEAQFRNGRTHEAAAALKQALVIEPQHAPSRKLLGEIQLAQQGGTAVRR